MKNILNKKVSCPLWAVIVIIAFIALAIGTGNITVSDSFITVIKLISIIAVGGITVGSIDKLLINYKDSIIEFFKINTTKIIIVLVITLVATLLSGCMYQVSIGAMNKTVLNKIMMIEFGTVLLIFVTTLVNIIRLFNTKKNIKRKTRMRKLASLVMKSNINIANVSSDKMIIVKALVTDLYNLSVQDIIVNNNINIKKLYKSEVFLSLLNESTTVTKDLGSFKNSFDILVANNYISTLEAATAKVVTFYVDREVLELL